MLTRWTVRVAVVCYFLSLLLRLHGRQGARSVWTAGFLFFLVHVVYAFHYFNDWSHDHAVAETSRQTREVVGLDWGGGVYFNYVFALVWGVDVVWWWASKLSYERRAGWIEGIMQGYMAFIVFNATIVFGEGMIRWGAVVASAGLLGVLAWKTLAGASG